MRAGTTLILRRNCSGHWWCKESRCRPSVSRRQSKVADQESVYSFLVVVFIKTKKKPGGMDAPAPAAPVPDLQSKQELVDRFARLKTVWLDLASTCIERDELAAVAEELRLLGSSRQSTVALCAQRHAAAEAQHDALQRTLRSAS